MESFQKSVLASWQDVGRDKEEMKQALKKELEVGNIRLPTSSFVFP